MASKKQNQAKAQKLGALFEETSWEMTLSAPDGKTLASGLHYSSWEKGHNLAVDIYDDFWSELRTLKDCECCLEKPNE